MNNFIFITDEGYTFQPNSDCEIPDIENMQVIGFAYGTTAEEAYTNLLADHEYLKENNFDHIFCYKLDKSYENTKRDFHLKT